MKKSQFLLLLSIFIITGCSSPLSSSENNDSSFSSVSTNSSFCSESDSFSTSSTSKTEEVILSNISLAGDYKTTFFQNEEFSYSGLIVFASYSDNSKKEVSNYMVSTVSTSQIGIQDVIVSYTEKEITKSTTYQIEVVKRPYNSVFNEPYIGRQSYLNHIGDIFSVWKEYRGSGVTIAVIDKAFDAYHEEFKDENGISKVSPLSASFSNNGGKVTTSVGIDKVHDLSDSHGTFCAGVAGASLNSKGVIGIAPEAKLMLLKTDGKPKSIAEAFKYAADNGAKVVTISIGSYYNYVGDLVNDGSDLGTVFDESLKYCRDKNVVVVSAAGNGGLDNQPHEYTFPGACDNVIGAGGLAFNSNGEIWYGSSYNSSSLYQFVDVFAPSDMMFNCCNYMKNGQTILYDGGWNGTSFASPIVAGMAALYFEKYPNNSAEQFETDLYASCHKITTSSIASSDKLGYGRVDVSKLMAIENSETLSIKVKTNWSSCYLYTWNSTDSTYGEMASWPGIKMNKENGYYEYQLDLSKYDSVIFTNGSGTQTIDILASSFSEGYIYDLTSSYQENSRYMGTYIK